eukprot:gene20975-27831_t
MEYKTSHRSSAGKKRKCEVDLDAERNLYSSFVTAANSISQLYSQSVQQQRKGTAAASRQTLERVMCFLLRDYNSADVIPRAELLHFLQQEYENIDGMEHLPHEFPAPVLPVVSNCTDLDSSAAHGGKVRPTQAGSPLGVRRAGSIGSDASEMHDSSALMNPSAMQFQHQGTYRQTF